MGLVGGGSWFLKENIWLQNSQEGGNSIQPKNKLITSLEAALKLNKNDPETLIFLNNARIVTAKNYTIVASVPLGTDPNGSLEILRGIAQAQHEINAGEELRGCLKSRQLSKKKLSGRKLLISKDNSTTERL